MPHPNQVVGRGSPTVNYEVVKATNADAAVWGSKLIRSRHVGAISNAADIQEAAAKDRYASSSSSPSSSPPAPHSRARATPAGPGKAVTHLERKMLVGVFSDGRTSDEGYMMVVDLRTSMEKNALKPRVVNITLAAQCASELSLVKGGAGGWGDMHWGSNNFDASSGKLRLKLEAGGGALVRVGGKGCGAVLRGTRQWWFNPSAINLRHSYPEESVKATSYNAWNPQASALWN